MQEKYVEDLIQRINTPDDLAPGMSSSETISWKAYREAEKLTDDSLYPILKNLILLHPEEEYVEYREAAYHILIQLLKNVPTDEYFTFYLEQLEKEHNSALLSTVLFSSRDLKIPPAISVDSIIALTKSEDLTVRRRAIWVLQSSATPESTDYADENDTEWEQKSREAAKDELISILEDFGIKRQEDFFDQDEEEGAVLYETIKARILEVYDVDEDTIEELLEEILGE